MHNYYGLEGIKFMYHNDWSDPTLIYKGREFNVHLIEDAMYEMFKDDNPEITKLSQSDSEECFAQYMIDNSDYVYELADNVIESL